MLDDIRFSVDSIQSSWIENETSSGSKISAGTAPYFESSIQLSLYVLLTILQRTQTELAVIGMGSDMIQDLALRAAVSYAVLVEDDPSTFIDLEALAKCASRGIGE